VDVAGLANIYTLYPEADHFQDKKWVRYWYNVIFAIDVNGK
jgi:hypothetical protein